MRIDETGENYDLIKAKVLGRVSNKVEPERDETVPMDIGEI